MIIWAALLALAADPPSLAIGIRGDPATWITNDDYPAEAMRQGLEGAVKFRATVDPTGTVTQCEILISSGYDVLDDQTCRLIQRRGRFEPARDKKGRAIAADFQRTVRWQIPRAVGSHMLRVEMGPNGPICTVDGTVAPAEQQCPNIAALLKARGVALPVTMQLGADGTFSLQAIDRP